jgi:hypothetical protein
MAEDGDLIVAELSFFGVEEAAHQWLNAEERKHIQGGSDAIDAFGVIAFRDVEARPAVVRDLLEYVFLAGDIEYVWAGDAGLDITLALLVPPLTQAYELFGVGVRQGTKNDGAYQAEDCGVRTDAKRESKSRGQGETGTLEKRTERVAYVGKEAFDPGPAPGFVSLFADKSGVAYGAVSGVSGIFGRKAMIALFFFLKVEIGLEFAFEIGVALSKLPPFHLSSPQLPAT